MRMRQPGEDSSALADRTACTMRRIPTLPEPGSRLFMTRVYRVKELPRGGAMVSTLYPSPQAQVTVKSPGRRHIRCRSSTAAAMRAASTARIRGSQASRLKVTSTVPGMSHTCPRLSTAWTVKDASPVLRPLMVMTPASPGVMSSRSSGVQETSSTVRVTLSHPARKRAAKSTSTAAPWPTATWMGAPPMVNSRVCVVVRVIWAAVTAAWIIYRPGAGTVKAPVRTPSSWLYVRGTVCPSPPASGVTVQDAPLSAV